MRKILLMGLLLLSILLAANYAQPRETGDDEVMKKLDQILQNQAEMLDYLKFIKNRSR